MKLKAPNNLGGFSHQGKPVVIPASRVVDVTDDVMIDVMLSHGFTPVEATVADTTVPQATDTQRDAAQEDTLQNTLRARGKK